MSIINLALTNLLFLIASSAFAEPLKKDKLPPQCQQKSDGYETSLSCLKNHFVIDGERINPRIIQDLSAWISDRGTQVQSISLLESQKSNRYFCQEISEAVTSENCQIDEHTEFDYFVIGKTDNDIFVLETVDSMGRGGGSGVFYRLLLVRIIEKEPIKISKSNGTSFENGIEQETTTNNKMILIEKVGELSLGDRTFPEFEIIGNKLIIEQCANNCNVDSTIIKSEWEIK